MSFSRNAVPLRLVIDSELQVANESKFWPALLETGVQAGFAAIALNTRINKAGQGSAALSESRIGLLDSSTIATPRATCVNEIRPSESQGFS